MQGTFTPPPQKSLFEFEAPDIDGNNFKFSDLATKKAIIVVNVACKCGLTQNHYKELVHLYEQYKDQGLEVLAFPCNQFGAQEPWEHAKIKEWVGSQFGVQFRLFSKVEVNGENASPIFRFLRFNGGLFDASKQELQPIAWNFGKFLLDGKGQVRKYFDPKKSPLNMEPDIQALLGVNL